MSTHQLPLLASFRRQQLLIEFGSLQAVNPEGVYVSLTPGDSSLWTGVLFVRKGPYAPAILRFQIRFPPTYPDLPPLLIFSTDVFHPLLVPLTTYTFSTGSDTDTISATDEERLPPGGFSLRHGFPHWFGRTRKAATSSQSSSRNVSGSTPAESRERRVSGSEAAAEPGEGIAEHASRIPVTRILEYVRSCFDDAAVLDTIPLEAAGNPSAWQAWRAHRRALTRASEDSRGSPGVSTAIGLNPPGSPQKRAGAATNAVIPKQPGEWNWEGVWLKRARAAIVASASEPALFGGPSRGADDSLIRFSQFDDEIVDQVRDAVLIEASARN